LLVAGAVATVDPLMNHWYFIGVRAAAMHGAVMPVPAGHRTYESLKLTGLRRGNYVERLTSRRLSSGQTAQFNGLGPLLLRWPRWCHDRRARADMPAHRTTIAGRM
jgi:hypothetical protein